MSAHNLPFEAHSTQEARDPGSAGTITVDRSPYVLGLISAGAEARTLSRPTKAGVSAFLYMKTDGGDITLTVTGGINEDGDTTFVFSDPGQFVLFVSAYESSGGTYFWRKVSDYGLGNVAPADSVVLDELSGLTATVAEVNAAADVSGRLVSITDADTPILAANSGKPHVIADVTADRTFTLPTPASGLEYHFYPQLNAADGHDWIFDTGSNTNYFVGGVTFLDSDAGAGADELSLVVPDGNSNSKFQINLPQPGTMLKFICDGTLWIVAGVVCSTTAPAYADQ